MTYAPVHESRVDPDLVWKVHLAADLAAAELGLPAPEIVFVVPAPPGAAVYAPDTYSTRATGGELAGFLYHDRPGRIYVRADLAAHGMQTACHELRHSWQQRTGFAGTDAEREADAESWSRRFMERGFTAQEIARWMRR